MKDKVFVADNVKDIVTDIGKIYGIYATAQLFVGLKQDFASSGITSPIEHILYSSMVVIQAINKTKPKNQDTNIFDFKIHPQFKIDKYRADFMVEPHESMGIQPLVVECDSQEFHERNEQERRKEKERDRIMQKEGYVVFRYTGKEIINEHLRIATEVISYVTAMPFDKLFPIVCDGVMFG